MKLDIVIPTYNNEKQISNIYNKICDELKDIKYTIIFIDDNSNDKTLELLKNIQSNDDEKIKLLSMSKSFGKDTCIFAGLKHTKNSLVCIYDIDTSINTSYIRKMYDYMLEHNEYDQICMQTNTNNTNKLFNSLFNLNIDLSKTYNRLMKRNVVLGIIEQCKNILFSKYVFELIGFNTYYYKYESKKAITSEKLKKYIIYSKNPFHFIKYVNYLLITITFIFTLLSILSVIKISNNLLLIILLLLTIIQLSTTIFITNNIVKKEYSNYYILKDKIGFDENIL